MDCSTPGFPVLQYLLEFAQSHVHCLGDAIQPYHPVHPLLFLPSIFPSIRVFSHESALLIRWPKYWTFSFSISPSNEYSGLISGDSQESSPAPQFESISSSGFTLLYGPILTPLHDYWKNHSFDYTDLCWQSDVSAF